MSPSQADLARALGIDPALVTRYKARGMPVDSVEAAAAWKAENVRAKVPAPGATAAVEDAGGVGPEAAVETKPAPAPAPQPDTGYSFDRARREKYEADLAEIKLREQQGDLVRCAEVRSVMAAKLGEVRTNLMQIPARLAPLLAPETDQGKVHALLDSELRTVLNRLTGDH